MSCQVFQLKELGVELFEIQEVLLCIFHTIVFHRALGLVRPKDIDLELFDITYVQCGDVEVETKIDEKVTKFIDRVKKHPSRKHQICVSFYEVKNKQTSWFTNQVEQSSLEERDARHSELELALHEVLFQIINFGSEKKDHIPSIPNLEGASFPFEITIACSSESAFGMELLNRMLHTGRPTMLG
ncbi:unnamed protein product [Withania somnifera]